MPLIYITGIAGAGKSEVYTELKKRGLEVYGTDEDQLAGFYNNETGEKVDNPADNNLEPTAAWRELHTWRLPRSTIEAFKNKSQNSTIFVCGVAADEVNYLDLFDKLFALVIDDATLVERIMTRTNNSFGKSDHEFDQIKMWQAGTPAYYEHHNFIQIDATKPVEQVVDAILAEL